MKTYIEIKKYGMKNVFKVFQKNSSKDKQLTLAEYILKKINIHHILKTKNGILIAISESGIYLIKVIDYYGKIIGDAKTQTLTLKNEKTETIPNFFSQLQELECKLQKELSNIPLKKIIVSKETCTITVPYDNDFIMVGIHNFYCQIQMWMKEKSIQEKDVIEIERIISNTLKEEL